MQFFDATDISFAAQTLWAKKARNDSISWLPLYAHLSDTAGVAEKLWKCWISSGVKNTINHGIGDIEIAKQLFIFLAAVHDLGKATPVFQAKPSRHDDQCNDLDQRIAEKIECAGLLIEPYREFTSSAKTPHALATQIILENEGCKTSIAAVLGAHHGKPQNNNYHEYDIDRYKKNYHMGKDGKKSWVKIWRELINYALRLSGFSALEELPEPNMAAQVLLSGLVIMADWIASNDALFPLIPLDGAQALNVRNRIDLAWKELKLPHPWESDNAQIDIYVFQERFGFEANVMQKAVFQAMNNLDKPGIVILEAPMGHGKTEAALVAAEILAKKTKRIGVFFALPTQATADGVFPRFMNWVGGLSRESSDNFSLRLSHGKAQFNQSYQKLFESGGNTGIDEEYAPIVHEWFNGPKKALLADFVVGTIDQLLLAALKHKFVMLRHVGLANKVVIIDEVHAYDAYMNKYLERALRWLGAYSVPVVVLSATLSITKRRALVEAYLWGKSARGFDLPRYPVVTFTNDTNVMQVPILTSGYSLTVNIENIDEERLLDGLEDLLSGGGCVGVVVNTVRRAQALAKKLRGHFGVSTVRLLHSRFLAPDRAENEKWLLQALGKPNDCQERPQKCIIVGTQVLEQSLDIDFDILITDVCPMDLLLQRIGRLQRHKRNRSSKFSIPRCLIINLRDDDINSGSVAVYKKYPLMKTKALLPRCINLPEDISVLVQSAYGADSEEITGLPDYAKAKQEWDDHIRDQEKRACDFQICEPWPDENIIDLLNTDVPEKCGEASVRDSDESIDILAVKEKAGRFYLLSGNQDGLEIPSLTVPEPHIAKILACQNLRLPAELCTPRVINGTIEELESLCKERFSHWQESAWLKGSLFLVFDTENNAKLNGYALSYNREDGLVCEKIKNG